jgi:hypothetical protein
MQNQYIPVLPVFQSGFMRLQAVNSGRQHYRGEIHIYRLSQSGEYLWDYKYIRHAPTMVERNSINLLQNTVNKTSIKERTFRTTQAEQTG